jgi:hypothetical protein
VALKQLPRDGRSGKSRRPAILECGPSPRFPKSEIVQLGPEPKESDPAFRRRASVDYAVREKLMNFASAALSIRLSPGSFLVCLRSATYVFGRPKETPSIVRRTRMSSTMRARPGQPSVSGSSRRSRTSSPRIPPPHPERHEHASYYEPGRSEQQRRYGADADFGSDPR